MFCRIDEILVVQKITLCDHHVIVTSFCCADGLIVCHLPYGPTAYFTLSNVVMRHDLPEVGTMSEAFPHLIFNKFSSKLGNRVSMIRISCSNYGV